MKKPTISCLSERIKICANNTLMYKHAGRNHSGSQTKKHKNKRVFFKKSFKLVPKQFSRIRKVI